MKQFNALFGTSYPSWLSASGIELVAMHRKGDKDVVPWLAWKLLKDCTALELKEANLRSLFPEEVCLDCEDVLTANAAICKLLEAKTEFFAWNTGSRGVHISIFFKEMASMTDEQRAKIRKAFAETFGTDKAKGSARTMIALENRPHWKGTGKVKTLLTQNSNPQDNILPVALLELAAKQPTLPPIIAEDDLDLSSEFLAEVWRKNPKVYACVQALQAAEKPVDRSALDFPIVKCMLENGARKLPIFRFLKTLKNSKVQTDGWHYFANTYNQAIRRLMQ